MPDAPGSLVERRIPGGPTACGLRAGWDQVRLLSRLEHGPSNRLLADALTAEGERAAQALEPPLERWPGLPERRFATYRSDAVQTRIRRVMDFVLPGDRVLDIGVGGGYPSCLLIRDSGLSSYCGVDLSPRYVDIARAGVEANGLGDADVVFEPLDVHDVDRAFFARHRPDLVLLLEVLEHVADPERAMQALGRAMDVSTCLLFTVPMLGRLEGMWGHLSLFDEARIVDLCDRAGLMVHHVEPVHNTWILALAAHGQGVADRGLPLPEPLAGRYSFRPVALPGEPEVRRTGAVRDVGVGGAGLSFGVGPGDRGGVAVPLDEPEVLRLEFTCEDPESLVAVTVEATAGGEPRMAWTWSLTPRNRPEPRPVTCVFRDGRPTRHFKSTLAGGPAGVDEVKLELTAGPDGAGATIHRLASVARRP